MIKNDLVKRGKKQFVEITTILNNSSQRAKLQNYIDETVRCKQKILDERESIRVLRESAVDELGIEPKIFNALVSLFFNNNFEQKREELETLETAIDVLLNSGTTIGE